MRLTAARFCAVLFAALALAPAPAHLLELPNKIGLARDAYFAVQQIYRGWAWLGVVVVAALLSALALAVLVRKRRREFVPALIAFGCIVATQVIFWTLTFPANRRTSNWTVMPDDWIALRAQWEYSHAASAVLNLVALVALIVAVPARAQPGPDR